jgi:hypothetical protein
MEIDRRGGCLGRRDGEHGRARWRVGQAEAQWNVAVKRLVPHLEILCRFRFRRRSIEGDAGFERRATYQKRTERLNAICELRSR